MGTNTILPPDQAFMMAECLMDAVDRMPALTIDQVKILLDAAQLMAEHSCNAVIASAVADQSFKRYAKPKPPSD